MAERGADEQREPSSDASDDALRGNARPAADAPDKAPPAKPPQDAKPKGGDQPRRDDKPADDKSKEDKPEKPKKSLLQRPVLLIGGAVVLIALIVGGIFYWLHARQYETTDDAYVDGHIVRLAPQVAGVLSKVYVEDNRIVGPGQPVAVIDSRQSNARLAQQQAQASQARATLANNAAQVDVAAQALRAARAGVLQPRADLIKAEADLARYRRLQAIEPGAVAPQTVDQAVQAVRAARAQRDQALRQADQAAAQVRSARTQIGAGRAQVAAADAAVAQQAVDVGYGKLVSPIFGYVTNRSVNVGSYVAPGQQIMAIVPLDLWVTANFKETQLKLMRVGQPVDITVDALPDVAFRGHVDSFSRGAGQAFGLLPAQNATGNFVKVVQRVPVKIIIDSPSLRHYPLGPGMSVTPRVKVR